MAVPQALTLFHAPCSRQNLYQRISKWKKALKPPNDAMMHEIDAIRSGAVPVPLKDLPLQEDDIIITPAHSSKQSTTGSTPAASTLFALDSAPSWMDRDKIVSSMNVCAKRTPTEVCRSNFETNSKTAYYNNRYSTAFKAATKEFKTYKDDDNLRGKRGYGIISVVKKINSTLLSSPNDRRLTPTTVYEAMEGNCIGVSPHKRGRPSIIPDSLHTALATHSSMLQVSGEGEASSSKIKTLT